MKRVLPRNANLIPDVAELKYKGVIFDVYQWEQKLYDGTSATFEMLRRTDTVLVIAIDGDKLLCAHEKQPPNIVRQGLMGGRVDPGEDWEQAAKREVLEESGLKFKNWRLVSVAQPVSKIEWFVPLFVAWDVESKINAEPGPGEIIEIEELQFSDFRKLFADKRINFLPDNIKSAGSIKELTELSEYNGE